MKYSLIGYQKTAAADVLAQLDKARRHYREDGDRSAFSLTATTGAGKTVIASAVIEALFSGSSDLGFDADPSAVVLWITDDPSLNEQTKRRIAQASELPLASLVTIDQNNLPASLKQHTLYFLNTQKLAVSSSLTKPKDGRNYTIWDTIASTIEDSNSTLYLVLDEAHRGMRVNKDRSTIVQNVINGHNGIPPVPIVWGISATMERFNKAMAKADQRTMLPVAQVPVNEVQASGLLKDTILLYNPDKDGQVDTTLLRTAVQHTIAQSQRWLNYCESQKVDNVLPLLVVQVGNLPKESELKRLVGTIYEEWEGLPDNSIVNVFGEHKDLGIAGRLVRNVAPETVQDDPTIRVLLAKDAVSTGWDCPRAEVLYSLRGGQDKTYITQLIGRMVRTPLARRIPSDEMLNSVVCLLPKFNATTTMEIAHRLTKGEYDSDDSTDDVGGGGFKVLHKPVTLTRNAKIPKGVFELFAALPTETRPNPLAKPIPRLIRMATALAGDGLLSDANEQAMQRIFEVLDGQAAQHKASVAKNKAQIMKVQVEALKVALGKQVTAGEALVLDADSRTIDDAFRSGSRLLTQLVSNGYQKRLAETQHGDVDLIEAKLDVAAMALVPEIIDTINAEAEKLVNQWMAHYNTPIKHLGDARIAEYESIRSESTGPMPGEVRLPETKLEEAFGSDGTQYATRQKHLLSDAAGGYPVGSLNTWELKVIDTEIGRPMPKVIGWYRNPSQATENAVQVPYLKGDKWSTVQPDFVFFSKKADGKFVASIVDPHGDYFADSLDKLRGLAAFVERHEGAYLRVDSLAENSNGDMVALDLTRADVRAAILGASKATDLFNGEHATPYL